jgi:protease-4
VWTGAQALQRGLVDQMGGLRDAVAYAAKEARLGDDFAVRYIEPPLNPLQRFLLGVGDSASARVLASLGLQVPKSWLMAMPRLLPELSWLQNARAGKPVEYAYCFCRLQP